MMMCYLQFWHYALISCFSYYIYFSYTVETPFLLRDNIFPVRMNALILI